MKLLEFFGRTVNPKTSPDKENEKFSKDDLFWFLVDNDNLHKTYFFPIAKKIKKQEPRNKIIKDFLPMVNKGCLEFSKKEKILGKPSKLFPKDLREELCQKLYDHYRDDVIRDQYNLGD